MSRAKERLTLSHIAREPGGGEAVRSRFVAELPAELLEHTQAFYD